MDKDIAAKLRAPFPTGKIGRLPRVTCGKCRDSRERVCDSHSKSKCGDCGSWITSAHIHLDFVGHADATDRFLEVDPEWTWEPLAIGEDGLPRFDEFGGLWIRLTIAGVTRLGYGDADGKRGGNAIKESIGDALRNASMRFGVALDLWRKDAPVEESAGRRRRQEPDVPVVAAPTSAQRTHFDVLAKRVAAAESETELRAAFDEVKEAWKREEITTTQANDLRAEVTRLGSELATAVVESSTEEEATAGGLTDTTRKRIFALFRAVKITDDVDQHVFASSTLDRPVESFKTLTEDEGQLLAKALDGRKRAMAGTSS